MRFASREKWWPGCSVLATLCTRRHEVLLFFVFSISSFLVKSEVFISSSFTVFPLYKHKLLIRQFARSSLLVLATPSSFYHPCWMNQQMDTRRKKTKVYYSKQRDLLIINPKSKLHQEAWKGRTTKSFDSQILALEGFKEVYVTSNQGAINFHKAFWRKFQVVPFCMFFPKYFLFYFCPVLVHLT